MKNLAKAINSVMNEVKGIEKNSNVGSGSYAYKGVSDKDVKKTIGDAMSKNGLSLLPIDIDSKTTIERWTETYNGNEKQKQLVFSEVKTKYLLLHESGESVELCGYGHGTDTMDKAAGKATTYALKYALLYSFLVPTGSIDDTDKTHSEEIEVPKAEKWLDKMDNDNNLTKEWRNVIAGISKGTIKDVQDVRKFYKVNKRIEKELNEIINNTKKAA